MPEFAGFVYTAAGAGNSGLTVNLYARNGTSSAVATTTTNSDGAWTISHGTEGRFDVEIVVDASNKFRIKYDDQIQCELGEFGQLYLRGTDDEFTTKLVSTPTASRTITFPDATATALLGGYANTNSGVMSLTSTANSAAAVYLHANGGTSETVKIYSNQGTSVTEGAESINILSDAGGVGIRSTADLAKAINITSDGGTTGSIAIFNDQGTSVTEGAESISILSDAGGIGIRSTADLANAVNVTVDGGTTSTMTLFNDQGTAATEGAASIQLLSDVGGINIKSGLDAADAILLTADGGTSEKIRIHADQGTGVDSIELISDAGGIELNVEATVGITGTAILDENNLASDSDIHLATQQSIKAYVDAQIATEDTIAELNDTNISAAAAGHLLIYDNSASVWDNAALSGGNGLTATLGDGTLALALDLKSNGGAVIESNELAVDLGANSITGTLAVGDGGTGVTTFTSNAILTGNSGSAIQAEADLTFSSNKVIPTASAHDAAGTALTISAGATTAGTSDDQAGGALTFQGGQGKGDGAGGNIVFQTANAGSPGSSLNALATALTLSDDLSASFAGAVVVTGNLTVNGTTTTVDTATLSVEDPLIALATGNSGDSLDVGFYGKYVDSGTKYSGLFRDQSDSDKWKLFATTGNSHEVPTTTVNTTSGFTLGTLVASAFEGDITGNVTGNADTVTTNANLTGHVTSTGNAAELGSFTKSQLSTAVSDGTPLYSGDVGTYTAGDGLDVSGGGEFSTDLVSNGGLEIQSTELSVAQGISQYDVAQFGAGVVDTDFLQIDGTSVVGKSASEVAAAIEASIDAVGTLAAGAISSGFGNIDIGSSTFDTTGAVSTGNLSPAGDVAVADAKYIKVGGSRMATAEPASNTTGYGVVIGFDSAGSVSAGDAVYINGSGKVAQANAQVGSVTDPAIGIATNAGASDGDDVYVLTHGIWRMDAEAFTAGDPVYVGESAGALTPTAPSTDGDYVQRIGIAVSDDCVLVMPSIDVIEHA